MKNNKMILGIALIVTVIFPTCAQQKYNDKKEFKVKPIEGGKGVEIAEYVGDKFEVRIPPRIQNLPVTRIGIVAFASKRKLTNITIPNSVTSIGEQAFFDCRGLTNITIPNSVTSIGELAFHYCRGLTNITIPNSVTSIEKATFSHCEWLSSITIPDSVTSIGDNAFSECTNLISLTIGNRVTNIGDYAFFYCNRLTSITIPDSVTSIGDGAFYCKGLTSVTFRGTIPSSDFHSQAFDFVNYSVDASVDDCFVDYFVDDDNNIFAFYSIGDLRDKFYAIDKTNGTPGTYKLQWFDDLASLIWTKQ